MGTLTELLSIASSQIGKSEYPPKSNNILYNTWYYGREVSGKEYPWCMVFCQWCYDRANIKLPAKTASCTTMMKAAKTVKAFVNRNNLRPGDLVLFNFDGDTTTATHCGIVKTINGIKIEVIEGNTSVGNDTNGGSVMLRNRTTSQVVGAFRPIFDERGIEMTIDEFISNLTPKQAYDIWEKVVKHMATLPEPKWSADEKHWKRASDAKIVDGTAPEKPVKRDELIAILGRAKLL